MTSKKSFLRGARALALAALIILPARCSREPKDEGPEKPRVEHRLCFFVEDPSGRLVRRCTE